MKETAPGWTHSGFCSHLNLWDLILLPYNWPWDREHVGMYSMPKARICAAVVKINN